MLSYEEVKAILMSVHERFTYISDIKLYRTYERWITQDEIPEGRFAGDCEDFAQAVRKELRKKGYSSRLATCGVNSDNVNHCVCIFNNWVLDNIHKFPMRKTDLATYKFFAMSGEEDGEPWREIK